MDPTIGKELVMATPLAESVGEFFRLGTLIGRAILIVNHQSDQPFWKQEGSRSDTIVLVTCGSHCLAGPP